VQQINAKVVVSAYTKTDAGRRTLPIPQPLLGRLRAHWQNQQEERTLVGGNWNARQLLFPTETGLPVSPSNLLRHFRLLLTCAGLTHLRLHDLRHTCAILLGERTSDRVIAAILGHMPGTVTARYAKVTLPQMREALEALYLEMTGVDEGRKNAIAGSIAGSGQNRIKNAEPHRWNSASQACGATGIRTPDLLLAKQALYQLSYRPATRKNAGCKIYWRSLFRSLHCAGGRTWTRTTDLDLIRIAL